VRTQLSSLESLPVLAAGRVTLRPLREDDAESLYRVFSDQEAMRYWSTPPHGDIQRTRETIDSIHAGFERRSVLQWGIERNAEPGAIGTVTLLPDLRQPRAEIGFILGSAHWGMGYAADAQRTAIRFGFGELGLHRIEADTHPDNERSARSLERLGFQREGLLRERWVVDGVFSDSVIWGLLAGEWRDPAAAGPKEPQPGA